MGRPKTQSPICVECGRTPTVARNLCARCYQRAKYRGFPKEAIPPVVAEYAYPDAHPLAPTRQRLVLWTCPACGGEHLSAWMPLDEHPGLKVGTCRQSTAVGNGKLPIFNVLAPPPGRVLDAPPADLDPRRSVRERAARNVGSERDDDGEITAFEATVA